MNTMVRGSLLVVNVREGNCTRRLGKHVNEHDTGLPTFYWLLDINYESNVGCGGVCEQHDFSLVPQRRKLFGVAFVIHLLFAVRAAHMAVMALTGAWDNAGSEGRRPHDGGFSSQTVVIQIVSERKEMCGLYRRLPSLVDVADWTRLIVEGRRRTGL